MPPIAPQNPVGPAQTTSRLAIEGPRRSAAGICPRSGEGYRESTESWAALPRDRERRGMIAPALAVGPKSAHPSALAAIKALGDDLAVLPETVPRTIYWGRPHPLGPTDPTLMRAPWWGTKAKCFTR